MKVVQKGPRHWHRMCPACREARRQGCLCPEQHPTVVWDDCPVHGIQRDGPEERPYDPWNEGIG